jgi:hypothetical protein
MVHSFSVEMRSRKHVKNVAISEEARGLVLFEGELGELEELSLIEGHMLEIKGANGVLRIDLSEEELRKALTKPNESPT